MEKKEIYLRLNSYESACEYLGRENDIVLCAVHNKHHKAMIAMFKLVTIAEAWNAADGFVPDWANSRQYKYFPWFSYNGASAGFAFAHTYFAASYTGATIGSRLCFKSHELASRFGQQFVDLWNDFLLL
jgi:hypothetical protein